MRCGGSLPRFFGGAGGSGARELGPESLVFARPLEQDRAACGGGGGGGRDDVELPPMGPPRGSSAPGRYLIILAGFPPTTQNEGTFKCQATV